MAIYKHSQGVELGTLVKQQPQLVVRAELEPMKSTTLVPNHSAMLPHRENYEKLLSLGKVDVHYYTCLLFYVPSQMSSYKQIKEFLQTAKGEQIPKNTILVPDWLIWMFHYIDFWTLVSYFLYIDKSKYSHILISSYL